MQSFDKGNQFIQSRVHLYNAGTIQRLFSIPTCHLPQRPNLPSPSPSVLPPSSRLALSKQLRDVNVANDQNVNDGPANYG